MAHTKSGKFQTGKNAALNGKKRDARNNPDWLEGYDTAYPPGEKPIRKIGGARPGAGRPAFVPTDDERSKVEAYSGFGIPIDQIGALVRHGIHVDTLRAHFSAELIAGKAKANAKVGQTLFQKVMDGDTTAAIWWSKTQMRWTEVQKHEHTGKDGGAMEIDQRTRTIDPTMLSAEQRDALREILNSAMKLAKPSPQIGGPVIDGEIVE